MTVVKRSNLGMSLLGALALACAGSNAAPTPGPKPIELAPAPSASIPAEPAPNASGAPPAPSARPTPDADPSAIDPALIEAEAATPIPDAPSKLGVSGALAVVWLTDEKAERQLKSVLIEPAAGKAHVVAERKEPVLVTSKELWVIRDKKLASRACDDCERCLTEPPSCKQDRVIDLAEPFLKGLRSGKTLEPWRRSFSARNGCKASVAEHDTALTILGGVGSYYFFTVSSWDQSCGAAHPFFSDDAVTLDLDTGKVAELGFPQAPFDALQKRAHAALVQGCALDPKEQPGAYRATAAYAPDGELQGVFGFIMSAPYVCGSGPGHYSALSEQVSDWIPPELGSWGKLPDWVAAYLTASGAKYAFMISATRASAAKREFGKARAVAQLP